MQVLVVRGSKEFTLFPPSQSAHLYPVPHALGTMYSQVPRAALSLCQVVGDMANGRPVEGEDVQPAGDDKVAKAAAATEVGAAPTGEGVSSGCSAPQMRVEALSQDAGSAFPSLRQACGFRCTVRSGDMLYVPVGWWHSVRGSPKMNLTLNYW